MMICQQSEDGSKCPFPDYCKIKGPCKAPEQKPPKPSLAEFERLVLALRQSSYDLGEFVENNASAQLISETRKIDEQNYAALIDYVRNNLRIS